MIEEFEEVERLANDILAGKIMEPEDIPEELMGNLSYYLNREYNDEVYEGAFGEEAAQKALEFRKRLRRYARDNGIELKSSMLNVDRHANELYETVSELIGHANDYDDLSSDERLNQRQQVLKPKVDAYFEWAKHKYTQVAHNSIIGKALAYSIHQEEYLKLFLTSGDIPMDNNAAEQAIRPFTIGRKNFVLIGSSNGAKSSAMLYSLAETARANLVNTYQYFELLLTEIPKHMDDNDLSFIDRLLPWSPYVQETCPSKFKKS